MNASLFKHAKWLWEKEVRCNRWMLFSKVIELDELPDSACANIAAENKYYLYINGEIAVFEGGLNRGERNKGYFDSVDIVKHLQKGRNEILVKVWYWGNEGRNNVSCGSGGFIFACDALGLYSDSSWGMLPEPAQMEVTEPYPTLNPMQCTLYGGYDIGYDARNALKDNDLFCLPPACELGGAGDAPWGELVARPIPLWKFSRIKDYIDIIKSGERYLCKLPFGMQITPYMKINARGGERVDIRTDRYKIRGGPFGTHELYSVHRCEYIARKGVQEFEVLNWSFGERVIYTIPDSVEVIELGYRQSGYDCSPVEGFSCSDGDMNLLVKKCVTTMYACIRDNFMDCPDRERGQWIGDLSVQMPQMFYAFDKNSHALCKKAVYDIINYRIGSRIMGLVPGAQPIELPGQNLCAVSDVGMVAEYYEHTGDKTALKDFFKPLEEYLALWDFDYLSGKIITRPCDWYWLDHGDEVDNDILQNCWYYLGLRFLKRIAGVIGAECPALLEERMRAIKDNFDINYLHDDGYKSGDLLDDRANALALLCGFVKKESIDTVLSVFDKEYRRTPFTEYYLLTALFESGYPELAMNRLRKRYSGLIHNKYSTLWEDFTVTGTYNHAWTGGPLVLLNKYGCGLRPLKAGYEELAVLPLDIGISNLETEIETVKGRIRVEVNRDGYFFQISIMSPDIPITVGVPLKWFDGREPRLLLNGRETEWETVGEHCTVKTCGTYNELMGRK